VFKFADIPKVGARAKAKTKNKGNKHPRLNTLFAEKNISSKPFGHKKTGVCSARWGVVH
jgi:hypothetical protein